MFNINRRGYAAAIKTMVDSVVAPAIKTVLYHKLQALPRFPWADMVVMRRSTIHGGVGPPKVKWGLWRVEKLRWHRRLQCRTVRARKYLDGEAGKASAE